MSSKALVYNIFTAMKQNKQSGQVLIVIIIFGLLLWSFYSIKFSKLVNNASSLELDPNPVAEIQLPEIKTDTTRPGDLDGFGPNEAVLKTYKLCAANVKVNKIIPLDADQNPGEIYFDQNNAHTIKYQDRTLQGKSYRIYYPARWGELTIKDIKINNGVEFDASGQRLDFTNDNDLRFRQQKILYMVYLDSSNSGKLAEATSKNEKGEDVVYNVVNLYRDTSAPPLPDGVLCSDSFKAGIAYPSQSISPDRKQLQLEYFAFKDEVLSAHCKPAIYLYPENATSVNVKVKTQGKLVYTDPPYPETGWQATAFPSGKLIVNNKNYDYLYYESQIPDQLIETPNKGYVVSFADLPKLYDLILPKLGLNEPQSRDFKDYWLKTLPFSNFYFVGVIDPKNVDQFEPLEVTPKPDSTNRVRIYFQALDKRVASQIPTLSAPAMSGFKLVEWGGMFKSDPLHPFTCSQ